MPGIYGEKEAFRLIELSSSTTAVYGFACKFNEPFCPTNSVDVAVQPFPSVAVTVYVPTDKLFIVCPVKFPGFHKYEIVPVPPVAVAEAVPFFVPQSTGVDVLVIVSPGKFITFVVNVLLQPSSSVMTTVYVPATKFEAVAAFPPVGDQLYVYGIVPPDTTTVAVPLFGKPQGIGVELIVAFIGGLVDVLT